MWNSGESCRGCNSTTAGIVIDPVSRKASCSECGFDIGVSVVTTEPMNSSSGDFLPATLGNSQHGGSDPLTSIAAAGKRKFDELESSDHGNSQNLGSDPVSIVAMTNRLGLPAKIRAFAMYEKVGNKRSKKDPNAFLAASMYIACRLCDLTHTLKEISSVANEEPLSNISHAIGLIAKKVGIAKDRLIEIKAADFVDRFCSTLHMDGQAVKAAKEAAKSSKCVESRGSSPISVAAAVVYVIGQLSPEKKLLEDVLEATGVNRATMIRTYEGLYPDLPTIIPKWFAEEKDLKTLPNSLDL